MKARHEFQEEWEWKNYLRQHFSVMAMQGILTKYTLNKPEDQQIVCQISVELADELIKELNK